MPEWVNRGREPCSNLCGEGTQNFIYKCVEGNVELDDSKCANLPGREEPIDCEVFSGCENIWRYQPGQCDNSCGVGSRTETAECVTRDTFTEVNDEITCGPAPDRTRLVECEQSIGCEGIWSQAAECRATCGPGVRVSTVTCIDKKDSAIVLDESKCPSFEKPVPTSPKICEGTECGQAFEFRTVVGADDTCVSSCGTSWTTQDRECVDKGTNLRAQDNDCINAGLTKPGDKTLELYGNCFNFDECDYVITSEQCSQACGVGLLRKTFECRNDATLAKATLKDCETALVPPPDVANIPCEGTTCDSKPCPIGECEWVELGTPLCNTCEGFTEKDISCQNKDGLVIDDSKCANLERPFNDDAQECQNPSFCKNQANVCCSEGKAQLQEGFPCIRQDGVLLRKEECTGFDKDFNAEGFDCRDPAIEQCGSGGIDPTLPIVASVSSVVVVGLIVAGVYFYLWNRKRLNKNAQQDIAVPFSVIRSDSNEPLNNY